MESVRLPKLPVIVIATGNMSKLRSYRPLFKNFAVKVIGLDSFESVEKPQEIGKTAEENAELKALYYCEHTGHPVFCEDEALYVDFLPESEQPGVFVRRIKGQEEVSDDELLEHWERLTANAPGDKRTGHWHKAYALAFPEGDVKTVSTDTPIMFFSPSSKIRLPGWPMSSLQGPVRFGKPHSELSEKELKLLSEERDTRIFEALERLMAK